MHLGESLYLRHETERKQIILGTKKTEKISSILKR